MCYNCGCKMPNDPMGKGKVSQGGASLTEDDIELMAKKWDMSVEKTKKNILEVLQKEVGDK